MQRLPIFASNGLSELMLTHEGLPVWTVRCPEEERDLQIMAELWGGALEAITAPVTVSAAMAAAGDVIGIGVIGARYASLYAHLTGRVCREGIQGNRSELLAAARSASVVVGTCDSLDAALLQDLMMDPVNLRATPGFILGWDGTELRRVVLLRAAALFFSRGLESTSSWLNLVLPTQTALPDLGDSTGRVSTKAVLRGAPREAIRVACTEGASVLTISTHSDGVDAYLGEDLTLCPQKDWRQVGATDRAPRCIQSGICHRVTGRVSDYQRGLPVPEDAPARTHAIDLPGMFHAREISARILIWDSCWGAVDQASAMRPEYGVMNSWLSSPHISAVATTWKQAISAPKQTVGLGLELAAGAHLGEAVHRYNLHSAEYGSHSRLFILGDPDLRAVLSKTQLRVQQLIRRPALASRGFSDPRRLLAKLCLDAAVLPRTPAKVAEDGIAALMALSDAAQPPRGDRILALLTMLGPDELYTRWTLHATSRTALTEHPDCPYCHCPTDLIQYGFNAPKIQDRLIRHCPRCGMIEDRPLRPAVSVWVATSSAIFTSHVAAGHADALAHIDPQVPAETDHIALPALDLSQSCTKVGFALTKPAGPRIISVSTLVGYELSIYLRRIG